ncbi:MAG: hypothetical protein HY562_03865 [Ignavibacteriales bacterium]|nr:hypothetical protein [Ignavibacteriales bacterium]
MLAAFLLIVHVAGALYAFLRYRKESTSEGFLAVAFVAILFAVGWTISSMLLKPFLNVEFFRNWSISPSDSPFSDLLKKELNRDTIVLLVLTAGESVFYYFYLRLENSERSTSA